MLLKDYLEARNYSVRAFGKLCGLSFGPIVRVIEGRPVSEKCAESIQKYCQDTIEIRVRNQGRCSKPKLDVARRSRLRRLWMRIMNSCYRPNNRSYHLRGVYGVTVCKRWHNFELFMKDLGFIPEGFSSLVLVAKEFKEYNIHTVIWHKDSRKYRNAMPDKYDPDHDKKQPFQMYFDEVGMLHYDKGNACKIV